MSTRTTSLQVAAELALGAVTLATVFSFSRLFEDGSFAGPLLLAAVASHGIAVLGRRRGWGLGVTAVVSLAGFVLLTTWSFFGETTWYGMPTSGTLDAAGLDAEEAWGQFREVVAPAPALPGFVIALSLGIWVAAFLADWAAFRLWSPIEAIVPAGALFIFASLLGSEEDRVVATLVFLISVIAFELLHRVARDAMTRRWVNADDRRGVHALVASGALLGLSAVLVGGVVAPRLPLADDPPVVDWRGGGSDGGKRIVVSPLVDIQSRLVDQSDVELFTVRSEQKSYWRLTSLDIFDGQIWKSDGTYDEVSGTLPRSVAEKPEGPVLDQTFSITALASPWLPASYEPQSIRSDTTEAVYEPESGTLIVPNDRTTSDGAVYLVESVRPTFEPGDLAAASGEIPPEIADRFLELPADFSERAVTTAATMTAEAPTPYDKARALQDWFRADFIYDDQVTLGHDVNSIDAFLDQQRGYCQQFAGTFAAMARSLGIPSRVAVGFTWGEQDAEESDLWHVTGRQAHAWPEIYIAGAGWVDFDPTPGRAAPNSVGWTGLAEEQDVAPTATQPATTATTEPDPGAEADGQTTLEGLEEQLAAEASASEDNRSDGISAVALVVGAAISLLALVAALVAGTASAVTLARRRRRRRIVDRFLGHEEDPDRGEADALGDPRAAGLVAWEDVVEQLGIYGLRELPAETYREFVERAVDASQLEPQALVPFTRVVERSDFATDQPTVADLRTARDAMDTVESHVTDTTSAWARARRLSDPRPLLPRGRTRLVTEARASAPRA